MMGVSSSTILRLGLIPAMAVFLVGCEEGAFKLGSAKPGESAPVPGTSVAFEERDVEAPDVFQATDKALWDGRPTFSGVWIAHPDHKTPEQVLIENTENGKFVVGALFHRDETRPGPKMILSSDAAAALEVLAGKPTVLKVTAMRRETVQVAVNDEPVEAKPNDGPEDVAATALAAIDAAEDAKPAAKTTDTAAKAATKPAETKTAAAAPTTPAPAPAVDSALSAPYIQIGFYSVEDNAKSAAKDLEKQGIASRISQTNIKGKTFWRVLAGPAQNKADRDKILKTVKGIGYSDAYAVKG